MEPAHGPVESVRRLVVYVGRVGERRSANHAFLQLLRGMKETGALVEELDFAYKIQEATSKPKLGINGKITPLKPTAEHPMGGSTDVGDVSFLVPVVRLGVTVAPEGTPWHSWAVVACGGMSIGHKGMVYAAKALSMSMVDLFTDSKLLQEVKDEFKMRKGDYQYSPMLPPGPPPIGEE